jgi:hypothetical protein
MTGELNSPRVMLERACYAGHALTFVGGLTVGLVAVAGGRWGLAAASSLLLGAATLVRHLGKLRLHFAAHEQCWVEDRVFAGDAAGDAAAALLALFDQLEHADMAPHDRQRLRRRIASLLREDERLVRLCRERIDRRHPYLRHAR